MARSRSARPASWRCRTLSRRSRTAMVTAVVCVSPVNAASSWTSRWVSSLLMLRLTIHLSTQMLLPRYLQLRSGVAFDGAAHAAGAAPAAAEFAARDGEHLDAVVLKVGVGGHVPLVGHDHSRLDGQHVAAVIPRSE